MPQRGLWEDLVIGKLRVLSGLAILLTICSAAHGQSAAPPPPSQPSLGDVARKYREEKAKNVQTAKPTLTNEDIFSSHGTDALGLGSDSSGASPAGQAAVAEILQKLDQAESVFRKLDGMDSLQLAIGVLHGDSREFPGRRDWERSLFAAKSVYVTRERALVLEMRHLLAEGLAIDKATAGKMPEDDPRVRALEEKMKNIHDGIMREEATLNAVITEGRKRAGQQTQ